MQYQHLGINSSNHDCTFMLMKGQTKGAIFAPRAFFCGKHIRDAALSIFFYLFTFAA